MSDISGETSFTAMAKIDGDGLSANTRRWICLNQVTALLTDGKVQLEDLVSEIQSNRNPNTPLFDNFSMKSKRSPRIRRIRPGPVPDKEPAHNPTRIKIKFKNPATVELPESKRKKGSESLNTKGKISKARLYRHLAASNLPTLPEDPTLPDPFKNHILKTGGCLGSLVFVIEKEISNTDASPGHARLSVPYCQVRNGFLTTAEVDKLSSGEGVDVDLVQPCLEERKMIFKIWFSTYVINSGWNAVCSRDELTAENIVRLWAFRRESNLCFALVKVS
ncbi:hypothetical protein STAS_27237 [Striga asiatica]|uniref:B3 domain-containing protein n=1 Tax=Striga asiatica TaxID=4170 RepID=A0A5A7QY82_STRAF|nr:hypothetical protein STAS_27237 [Striga asiatica]